MIKKLCTFCGLTCWHNPRKKKAQEEQEYRGTYCGHPPGGGPTTARREYGELIRKGQAAKVGRWI